MKALELLKTPLGLITSTITIVSFLWGIFLYLNSLATDDDIEDVVTIHAYDKADMVIESTSTQIQMIEDRGETVPLVAAERRSLEQLYERKQKAIRTQELLEQKMVGK